MKIRGRSISWPVTILTGTGLIALDFLVAAWWSRHGNTILPGKIAAVVSALLFAAAGVCFVFRWMEDWRQRREGEYEERLGEPVRPRVLLGVFAVCLGAELGSLGLFWLLRVLQSGGMSLSAAMQTWTKLDTQHYLNIARDGYISEGAADRVVELVFLPGYPLAVRLMAFITGDELAAAFAVSLLSAAGAGTVLYRLARLDTDHRGAVRTVKYTFLLPGAVFFPGPMSESLFLLLCVSCIYLLRRKRIPAACFLGALASFTRTLGLVLLVPVVYELLSDTLTVRPAGWTARDVGRRVGAFASVLILPLGFGAYCLICRAVTGDAFRFLTYQREHWDQSMGLFFHTASYQVEYVIKRFLTGSYKSLWGLWVPNLLCSFGALALMIPGVRRLRPSYGAFLLVYYVIAVGPTWLLSAPRYLAAAFPMGMALAFWAEDRWRDGICTAILIPLYVGYEWLLAARWQVW